MPRQQCKLGLTLVAVVYVVLAATFSIVNPLFEAPDEHHHYFTARYIAQNGKLPVATRAELYGQEAGQPPLYYLLASLVIAPINTSLFAPGLRTNPFAVPGDQESTDNYNAFIHSDAEAWPWRGDALAVHLVRLFSVALGLGTLLFIYGAAALLWPGNCRRALLATGVVAFLPQYAFLHSAVSNDALIIFLSSFALWQSIRLWKYGITVGGVLLLGLTSGLAMLTKMTGLALFVYSIGVLAAIARRDHDLRRMPVYLAALAGPALLVSVWLFRRNWVLYGDITATSKFIELANGHRQDSLSSILLGLDTLWYSAIGIFGWMSLKSPPWIFWVWFLIVLTAIAGGIVALVRSRGQYAQGSKMIRSPSGRLLSLPVLLVMWCLLVVVLWFQFNLQTYAEQGRLLFPILLPVALGLAYGIDQWKASSIDLLVLVAALATAVFSVGYTVPQAYARPAIVDFGDIDRALVYDSPSANAVELVAVEPRALLAHPGEAVEFALYWRANDVSDEPVTVSAEIVGRDDVVVGRLDETFHGGGNYPSDLWPVSQVIRDTIQIQLDQEIGVPAVGRLDVRLQDEEEYSHVATVKLVPTRWPKPDDTVLARFEPGMNLTRAELSKTEVSAGDAVRIELRWYIDTPPRRQFTTFIHLGDPGRPALAQTDSLSLNGDYTSDAWESGEVFDDEYVLDIPEDLPPAKYPISLGLYDVTTGERVPVYDSGSRVPHDALRIATIDVE